MSVDERGRVKCDGCNKYCRPVDSRIRFGCADPEAPEPYDPDDFCKKCAKELYETFKRTFNSRGYGYRNVGDWVKSKAELRAAKEAGLTWMADSGFNRLTGASVYHHYMDKHELGYFVEYLKYEAKRRDEERCKCWRKKNEQDNCPTCTRSELFCLCKYEPHDFF